MAGVPTGVDYGAVMLMGAAQDADLELLSDILPDFELVLLSAHQDAAEEQA
jgi:hypothetical protein